MVANDIDTAIRLCFFLNRSLATNYLESEEEDKEEEPEEEEEEEPEGPEEEEGDEDDELEEEGEEEEELELVLEEGEGVEDPQKPRISPFSTSCCCTLKVFRRSQTFSSSSSHSKLIEQHTRFSKFVVEHRECTDRHDSPSRISTLELRFHRNHQE